ncbi:hypothetical protein [Alicyclobacillus dauci]|uniref:Uncharacterized protein n=1 Tax=Alicyclobacillus dauci TaxID=1475485 RepID=A0ABY6YY42_9BACL|nr:hypothetical protein [Alicyclobacillus dauci]WAH35203.1 hypothetical protein NZD86_12860 [Alicyclobacillus dauci]
MSRALYPSLRIIQLHAGVYDLLNVYTDALKDRAHHVRIARLHIIP